MYLKRRKEKGYKRLVDDKLGHQESTHKNPVRVGPVEMDEALNAGHCVDPESGIQACVETVGIEAARSRRAVVGVPAM